MHIITGLLNSWFMILDNTEKHKMHRWYFSLRLVRHIISVGTQEPFLIINWSALHLHFMHLADAVFKKTFLSVCVFPGNWTTTFCASNAMLYHWATGTETGTATEWFSWCFISSFWASACFCIADRRKYWSILFPVPNLQRCGRRNDVLAELWVCSLNWERIQN